VRFPSYQYVLHGSIVNRGVVANVQEPHDARQSLAPESVLQKPAECGALGLAGAGVAVAGEIEKIMGARSQESGFGDPRLLTPGSWYQKYVQRASLSRRPGGLGDLPSDKGIQ